MKSEALQAFSKARAASALAIALSGDPAQLQRLSLKSRTDALQPQNPTERFRYDALDRLTCAYFTQPRLPTTPA